MSPGDFCGEDEDARPTRIDAAKELNATAIALLAEMKVIMIISLSLSRVLPRARPGRGLRDERRSVETRGGDGAAAAEDGGDHRGI